MLSWMDFVCKGSFPLLCYDTSRLVYVKSKFNRTIKRRVSKQIQCSITSPCANKFEMWIEVSKGTISYNHQKQQRQNDNDYSLFHVITLPR